MFSKFYIELDLNLKSRFMKRVSVFVNVVFYVVTGVSSLHLFAEDQSNIIKEISGEQKKPWKFDCEEKRECMRNCSSISVFEINGQDRRYVNQLRTECFRDCANQVDCNKER